MLAHVAQSLGGALPNSGPRFGQAKHWSYLNESVNQGGGSPGATITGTWTAPSDGEVDVAAMGGGGGARNTSSGPGGNSGAAGRTSYLPVRAGQQIQFSLGPRGGGRTDIGLDGGDASVTLPDGSVLTARGGKGATTSSATAATATGFQQNFSGLLSAGLAGASSPIVGLNLTQLLIATQPTSGVNGANGVGIGNGGDSAQGTNQPGGNGASGAITIDFYPYA